MIKYIEEEKTFYIDEKLLIAHHYSQAIVC